MALSPATEPLPSLAQQKTYIIENSRLLERGIKINILSLVQTWVYDEDSPPQTTIVNCRDGVNINLDKIPQDLVTNIFNIVKSQVASLNVPV